MVSRKFCRWAWSVAMRCQCGKHDHQNQQREGVSSQLIHSPWITDRWLISAASASPCLMASLSS